jgi:hypothetical protein
MHWDRILFESRRIDRDIGCPNRLRIKIAIIFRRRQAKGNEHE